MKVKYLLLLPWLFTAMSCEKEDEEIHHPLSALSPLTGEAGLSYSESLGKWNELKDQHGNSYVYHTTLTSFSGYGSVTELRIENGVITSRIYREYKLGTDGQHEIVDSYRESTANLGTHDKGASLRTIDQLYQTCASDYLTVDPETNTIHFQTAEVGLMTLCGFVPDGCLDDCLTAVNITAFDWLN